MPCQNTYFFKAKPPTFYNVGHIATNETALSFDLRSEYINPEDVGGLEDLLLAEAGYKENDIINPLDITEDGFPTSDERVRKKFFLI